MINGVLIWYIFNPSSYFKTKFDLNVVTTWLSLYSLDSWWPTAELFFTQKVLSFDKRTQNLQIRNCDFSLKNKYFQIILSIHWNLNEPNFLKDLPRRSHLKKLQTICVKGLFVQVASAFSPTVE
jgi:hypothetical protein